VSVVAKIVMALLVILVATWVLQALAG